ncbi:hypothetical protein [Arthrobacter sp. STN4]|uniref:hypothetical protein n=1 Tax=Arthrobacter sp. STN4 TaxID=2923276 RepID=UPI00211A22AE|nr:hypothetical protein [Arthrobacter sp. STN4]MCQ9165469.1 hypothetical protein [Arthrobacter sp. STN4]
MSPVLGDLPSWITMFIALGGVIYGGYNLRKLTLDRRRGQADRVYFGIEFDDGNQRDIIHVMNLSDAPITAVQLYFCDYPARQWEAQASRPLLMMGNDWEMDLRYPEGLQLVLGYVSFNDASNRTWYKLSNGKLYSDRSHPGIFAQLRYFPGGWVIRVRTWRLKSEQKEDWLRENGFVGGLFRWGFAKDYEDF